MLQFVLMTSSFESIHEHKIHCVHPIYVLIVGGKLIPSLLFVDSCHHLGKMSSREGKGSKLWNHSLWGVMCFVQLESSKNVWEYFAFPCIAENIWSFGNISLSLILWQYLRHLNCFLQSPLPSFCNLLCNVQVYHNESNNPFYIWLKLCYNVPSRLACWVWLYFPF